MFEIPKDTIIEWKSCSTMPQDNFIAQIKEIKFVPKGFIYNLVRVNKSSVETSTFQSILVVSEFLEVFRDDLPGVPLDREKDFGIDLIPDIHHIFIPPYRMDQQS